MSPNRILARLCRRHDVPFEDAKQLLPLVTRASETYETQVRDSLMRVVENSLTRLSEERRHRKNLETHLDRQYLIALAAVLHPWEPRELPPAAPE
ncbi:MAG: hypothetical protein K8S98_03795 [Planctomycetes bacterium]|nr:hypothetical protein [Planctomycetota bacterium]